MKQPVKRNFTINYSPSQDIRIGNIFKYVAHETRIKGLVLVHKVDPQHEFKELRKGWETFTDIAVVEIMPSDYCLFWVDKAYLQLPTQNELSALKQQHHSHASVKV
jgi:hypothetical protein